MKTSIQAASMFLWLQLDWMSQGGNVEQHPSTLSVQEGDSSVINCTYSDSFSDYFPWYKQEPGQGLQLFSMALGVKEDGRLKSTVNSQERYSTLHISATQLEDSGTYLCAAEAQCSQGVCSPDPKCSWACKPTPNTERPVASTAAFALLWVF
uniref:Ig-like domain-containing protein n=1 Tax=Oryctolagus cuniculus TaxID=9986 RepID=A0A5F9DGP5_RABIT